jgi:hypothetical protein
MVIENGAPYLIRMAGASGIKLAVAARPVIE